MPLYYLLLFGHRLAAQPLAQAESNKRTVHYALYCFCVSSYSLLYPFKYFRHSTAVNIIAMLKHQQLLLMFIVYIEANTTNVYTHSTTTKTTTIQYQFNSFLFISMCINWCDCVSRNHRSWWWNRRLYNVIWIVHLKCLCGNVESKWMNRYEKRKKR